MDSELVSALMIMEMAIVMGFAAPLVVILCLCTMLTHLAVFYVSRVHLNARFINDTKPICAYLIISLALSTALTVAYFWDNRRESDGPVVLLVLVGCPALLVIYLLYLACMRLRDLRSARQAMADELLVTQRSLELKDIVAGTGDDPDATRASQYFDSHEGVHSQDPDATQASQYFDIDDAHDAFSQAGSKQGGQQVACK